MFDSIKLILKVFLEGMRICYYRFNSYDDLEGNSIRNIFYFFGPTGIKIGQVLSHRRDILKPNICKALSELTDNVIINDNNDENEILSYVKQYINYESQPIRIGSGCIAVTYSCVLKDKTLLLKVKRKNIEKTLIESYDNLYSILWFFSKFGIIDYDNKLEKIKDTLLRQTDFELELDELEYFYSKYRNNNEIVIPKVYRYLSNENIIAQEYLIGNSLKNINSRERLEYGRILWKFSFESSFIDGHWHSDLHKGNIIFLDNYRIGIIDYGLTGVLNSFERAVLLNYNTHILKREWHQAARLYVTKMTEKRIRLKRHDFVDDISQILENNFDSDPNIPKCVSELATCSRKYGTNFNNKYVQFELAFSTFSFTMSELGYPNIYDFMRKQIL
tara:strand:- start:143 stop:1309 length:1167 start_codon:yes stop_codon:yes gene_type:complete